LAFAQAGADVMITARTQKDVDATAEECRKYEGKVGSYAADGTILSDLESLVKQVSPLPMLTQTEHQLGPVDILVCNA
jgi:NAD(P)-dependent dehydrogenase (short-subunit alcohol dehydrogenase family)